MHFGPKKVAKVILLQTWPTANRRSGMWALARLNADGRISLHDNTRKYPDADAIPFYPDAKENVHFKSMETIMFDMLGCTTEELMASIDWNQEPVSDEDFLRLFGFDRALD